MDTEREIAIETEKETVSEIAEAEIQTTRTGVGTEIGITIVPGEMTEKGKGPGTEIEIGTGIEIGMNKDHIEVTEDGTVEMPVGSTMTGETVRPSESTVS
mmetsp:Transcript_31293/g.76335  ORF Transcript_31293/g.76335 Transcript_31293/m.76335 type:complete len:100 (-) Transcript_31293:91-390(-)